MSRVPFSFFRVGLIAANTLREARRQRLLGFLGLLALALVVGGRWMRELNFGASELKFLADLGLGAMAFFGAVLAIVATAQLFFSEIERRTLHTLLAKPVWRAEFLLGKFLGVVVVLAVFCAAMTLLVAVILWSRETLLLRPGAGDLSPAHAPDYGALVAAGVAQWLKLDLLAALTLLVATFARTQLFTLATGFLVLVICHLQFFAQTAAAQGASVVSRLLAGGIALLFPNFQVFDLTEFVTGSGAEAWSRLAGLSLYAAGYVAAVLALAAVSFRQREI